MKLKNNLYIFYFLIMLLGIYGIIFLNTKNVNAQTVGYLGGELDPVTGEYTCGIPPYNGTTTFTQYSLSFSEDTADIDSNNTTGTGICTGSFIPHQNIGNINPPFYNGEEFVYLNLYSPNDSTFYGFVIFQRIGQKDVLGGWRVFEVINTTQITEIISPIANGLYATSTINFNINLFNGNNPAIGTQVCVEVQDQGITPIEECENIIQSGNTNVNFNANLDGAYGTTFLMIRILDTNGNTIDFRPMFINLFEQTAQQSIATSTPTQIEGCESPTGITENFYCFFGNILVDLFYPQTSIANSINSIRNNLADKLPFYFYFTVRDLLDEITETQTAQGSNIVLTFSPGQVFNGNITVIDWDDIKDQWLMFDGAGIYIIYVAWILFSYYMFRRITGLFKPQEA